MDIDTRGDGTAHGKIVTVHLTEDNWAEMPDRIKDAFHEAQSCSEILAVLTTIAIQLDRKQMEFQGALREATAKRDAAAAQRVEKAVESLKETGGFDAACEHLAREVGLPPGWESTPITTTVEELHVGDDNAFAGEIKPLPWHATDAIDKRSGQDRRNGDRRIFEATCLTANKRNLHREDRRKGERRGG